MAITADAPVTSRWRTSPARLARLLAGLWLFGAGEALLVDAALGNTPWTVLAEGVSLHAPLTVGTATVVIGAVVLCGWIPLRERPGLGTVLNVVVIGLALDVMRLVVPTPQPLGARAALVLLGIGLVGLGSGFYLTADLGPGPRDGWMTGLRRRFGWPLAGVRFGIEVSVLVAGWLLGGTVGLGTVAFALLIGPAVGAGVRLLGRPAPLPGHSAE
ncbi:MAG: YczE/YyaS/YitT family protein [Egibacteraceae bacterium]